MRCATRSWVRRRWGTSAGPSRRPIHSGRTPAAARFCATARAWRASAAGGLETPTSPSSASSRRSGRMPPRCAKRWPPTPTSQWTRSASRPPPARSSVSPGGARASRRWRCVSWSPMSDLSPPSDGNNDDGAGRLPRASGPAVLAARIRATPEDFRVDEVPGFEPSGSGEHLLLDVEKRGMNTAFAARHIAAWAGVPESAIGYAGLKDRHAVTRQRFSVHLPKRSAPELATLERDEAGEHLRVLGHAWHSRKLPRGALAGNRFVLVLRELQGDR